MWDEEAQNDKWYATDSIASARQKRQLEYVHQQAEAAQVNFKSLEKMRKVALQEETQGTLRG